MIPTLEDARREYETNLCTHRIEPVTAQEFSNYMTSLLTHATTVELWLSRLEREGFSLLEQALLERIPGLGGARYDQPIEFTDPQRAHDMVGAYHRADVRRGVAQYLAHRDRVRRGIQTDFGIIRIGVERHRRQYHHRMFNLDEIAFDTGVLGAVDANQSLREARPQNGRRPHTGGEIRKSIRERSTPAQRPYMTLVNIWMNRATRLGIAPDTSAITSPWDFPNVGLTDKLYDDMRRARDTAFYGFGVLRRHAT